MPVPRELDRERSRMFGVANGMKVRRGRAFKGKEILDLGG